LLNDKKRLELELEMLKTTADGGEQRMREVQHYEGLLARSEADVNEHKDQVMKKD